MLCYNNIYRQLCKDIPVVSQLAYLDELAVTSLTLSRGHETVNGEGDEVWRRLQDEVAGNAMRDILPVLAFASRTTPVALGMQVNELSSVPVQEVAAKVIVRGPIAQVSFGVVLVANLTGGVSHYHGQAYRYAFQKVE